jgi:hypothetical protein
MGSNLRAGFAHSTLMVEKEHIPGTLSFSLTEPATKKPDPNCVFCLLLLMFLCLLGCSCWITLGVLFGLDSSREKAKLQQRQNEAKDLCKQFDNESPEERTKYNSEVLRKKSDDMFDKAYSNDRLEDRVFEDEYADSFGRLWSSSVLKAFVDDSAISKDEFFKIVQCLEYQKDQVAKRKEKFAKDFRQEFDDAAPEEKSSYTDTNKEACQALRKKSDEMYEKANMNTPLANQLRAEYQQVYPAGYGQVLTQDEDLLKGWVENPSQVMSKDEFFEMVKCLEFHKDQVAK